jgi:hypothetical protein
VEAWGDVEVHRTGFRAESARPVSLFAPSLLPPRVRRAIARTAEVHRVPLAREWSFRGRRRPRSDQGLAESFRATLLAG